MATKLFLTVSHGRCPSVQHDDVTPLGAHIGCSLWTVVDTGDDEKDDP